MGYLSDNQTFKAQKKLQDIRTMSLQRDAV